MATQNYWTQFENEHLLDLLVRVETLDAIYDYESAIGPENAKKHSLQVADGWQSGWGPILDSPKAKELFGEVSVEVEDFLGVRLPKPVQFGYLEDFVIMDPKASLLRKVFDAYDALRQGKPVLVGDREEIEKNLAETSIYLGYSSKNHLRNTLVQALDTIVMQKLERTKLIPAIAHELAHHILKVYSNKPKQSTQYTIFNEGFCRGVERNISRQYGEREKNMAIEASAQSTDLAEMNEVYCGLARQRAGADRLRLLHIFDRDFVLEKGPTKHAMGNVLFNLWERKYGPGIYKDILSQSILSQSFEPK